MTSTETHHSLSAPAWSQTAEATVGELGIDPAHGLATADATARLQHYGRNQLRAVRRTSVLAIFVDQIKSIIVLLLTLAAVLAMLFSNYVEGMAIFAVVLINATIGFLTEWRALRSMEALRSLGHVETRIVRDGTVQMLAADYLVPGDIVLLEGGDIVTADIRLIEAANFTADESTLTGESVPVSKHIEALEASTPLAERRNMLYKGTAITRGAGQGVVVSTGLDTELGRISQLVTSAESQQTPLEIRLNALGERLAWTVIGLAILIAAAGVIAGRETFLAIEVAIALAVAAIPEGLPIVATIALARGMWRMAKRNALIARLSAVETLGATSVILTDKTGTLTENRMAVTELWFADTKISVTGTGRTTLGTFLENGQAPTAATAQRLDEVLTIGALCNNASVQIAAAGKRQSTGDPTEVALLVAAAGRELWRDELTRQFQEVSEIPFDPDTKLMATIHRQDTGVLVAVKGAPEALIPLCNAIRMTSGEAPLASDEHDDWLACAEQLGDQGLRTIAIASKSGSDAQANPFEGLTLLGILGLEDPPRSGVKEAIQRCYDAGINVVMVTGDHAATARNIAADVGIIGADAGPGCFVDGALLNDRLASDNREELLNAKVVSRVTPEQKLKLIDYFQQHNQIVAMTGDGVNDAPALKKADIGIAMGQRGTAVAKEASAMVLQDDEFATIVAAVSEGRAIFENIRKFVVYLFSCNISEVLIVAVATLAGAPLPLLPLQILFLNLVTDVFPALALGVGEGSAALMGRKPRPADEPVLTRFHWIRIALHSSVMGTAVMLAMMVAITQLGFDNSQAITVSFCTLALAQLWHVFNMRDDIAHPFNNEITRNPWIWLALIICVLLILIAVYVPVISDLLQLTNPGAAGWLLITGFSLMPLLLAPLIRYAALRFGGSTAAAVL